MAARQQTQRWTQTWRETRPGPATPPPADTAAVTLVRGPGVTAPVTIPIESDVITLGRHSDCDIVLNDMTVSRRHAELRCADDEVTITDLGSLNGTYVNREPVDKATLADGDSIWIGRYRLCFRRGTDLAARTAPEPALAGAR